MTTTTPTPSPEPTAPSPGCRAGWQRAADAFAQPGPRPGQAHIDLIVVHSISLPPGQYGGQAVQDLFMNRLDWDAHPYYQGIRGLQVSAHFSSSATAPSGSLSTVTSAPGTGVSAYRGRSQCNDDSVGIELEGLEGATFEPAQYDALAHLCTDLAQRYPIAHIAGHEHIAPAARPIPGRAFAGRTFSTCWAGMPAAFPPAPCLADAPT